MADATRRRRAEARQFEWWRSGAPSCSRIVGRRGSSSNGRRIPRMNNRRIRQWLGRPCAIERIAIRIAVLEFGVEMREQLALVHLLEAQRLLAARLPNGARRRQASFRLPAAAAARRRLGRLVGLAAADVGAAFGGVTLGRRLVGHCRRCTSRAARRTTIPSARESLADDDCTRWQTSMRRRH